MDIVLIPQRRVLVGEDPGKEGQLAWIDAGTLKPLGSAQQPLIGTGKGDTLDRQAMVRLVREIQAAGEIVLWVIEKQSPAGGGARCNPTSLAMQMLGYGIWLGILAGMEIPCEEVTSQEWRRDLNVPQPSYPRAKPPFKKKPGKKAPQEDRDAYDVWSKADRKRQDRQRKEGLERAVQKAIRLYPKVDMRRNTRCKVPSPDKAIAHLLARLAGMRAGLLPTEAVPKKKKKKKKAAKKKAKKKKKAKRKTVKKAAKKKAKKKMKPAGGGGKKAVAPAVEPETLEMFA